jgi:hypothetical protein
MYEPMEGATLWRQMQALQPASKLDPLAGLLDTLTRSHPSSEHRFRAIESQAKALARQSKGQLFVGRANYQRRIPVARQPLD